MFLEEAKQKFDVGRFNLSTLWELEVRKKYQTNVSNRFAALENLNYREYINRAWEDITVNIKIAAKDIPCLYELKQHILYFYEEYSRCLDQRKRAKMQ
jgi:hypothetical protein